MPPPGAPHRPLLDPPSRTWARARGRARRLGPDRRGTIAVVTALALPALLGVAALGIDVSNWAVTRVRLQRIADAAAMAGAARYSETLNGPAAVITAANVAELNGVDAGTRSGVGTTTLTDNSTNWTTTFSIDTNSAKISATVQTLAPIWFGRLFVSSSTEAISATAVAQVTVPNSGTACILGLDGYSTATTADTDVTLQGNMTISSSRCGLRSEGQIYAHGNVHVSVPAMIASGQINTSGNVSITCPGGGTGCYQQGVAQIPDPFQNAYKPLLTIPSGVASGTSSNGTYSPGYYPNGLSLSGNVKLTPGVYYVNGAISVNGNTTVDGSGGVTLISTGGITLNGNATLNLAAPSTGTTAGLLFGTLGSGSNTINGNSSSNFAGAIYAPNAAITISGNAGINAGSCLVVVGSTVTFSGNATVTDQGCSNMGVPPVYMMPAVSKLVQ